MNALLDEFGIGTDLERDESWRYSKAALRALSQQDFAVASASADIPANIIAAFDWPETRGNRLVVVNGRVSPVSNVNARISIASTDGRISIAMADSPETLHLVFVNLAGDAPSRWEYDCDIRIESGAASIIEQHVGDDGSDVLGSVRSKIDVGVNAALDMTVVSDCADANSLYRRIDAVVDSNGAIRTVHALGGGRLQRFDVSCDLSRPHSRYDGRGVLALRGRQHVDVHLDIRHSARDTVCDILWRGIADQRARGILRGAITVAAGADGADAKLETKNLLLSPHAEIDAQPVLEIHADEVKASHGATVGQLDERSMFYLRSRGIPRDTARELLIEAFAREAFGSCSDAVLSRLEDWLGRHHRQAARA